MSDIYKYRKNDIINYIKTLEKEIIFLQEVDNDLYETIIKNIDTHMNFMDKMAVWKNKNNIHTYNKDEYCVILIPKYFEEKYNIINGSLPIVSFKYGMIKTIPFVILTNKLTNKKIFLINIHLDRNNVDIDNILFVNIINNLKDKYNFNKLVDIIIIGGDFNENLLIMKYIKKYGININTHYNKETDYFMSNIHLDTMYEFNILPLDFIKRMEYIKNNKSIKYEKNCFTQII